METIIPKNENNERTSRLDEIFRNKMKIVDLFNTLGVSIMKEKYPKLKIKESSKLFIYQLFKPHIDNIERMLNKKVKDPMSKERLCFTLFKQMFFQEDFLFDSLSDNIKHFENILFTYKNNDINTEDRKRLFEDILELTKKEISFSLALQLSKNSFYCYYYAYAFQRLKLTNDEYLKLFLEFKENVDKSKYLISLDYKTEELNKLEKKGFGSDLCDIFWNNNNNFYLRVEGSHLVAQNISNDELTEILSMPKEKKTKNKKKKIKLDLEKIESKLDNNIYKVMIKYSNILIF